MNKTILPPTHTNFESAYVIADYPYGFTLRTQMRMWIETKQGHGQRVVSCTLNPKTGKWNKPKSSTYSQMVVLYIDNETGHVHNAAFGDYDSEHAGEFLAEYHAGLSTYQQGKLRIFVALHRAQDETGLKLYESTPEERTAIWQRAKEILVADGFADVAARIAL